jgi:hypothetical protein
VRAHFAVVLWAAVTLAQAPAHLTPEQRAQARKQYEDALRKFDVGKFDDAAAEFTQAYEATGDYAILYNIAQSYRLGERHDKALLFYKSFQRHFDAKTPQGLRSEVESRITELTASIDQAKHASTAPPTSTIRSGLGSEGTTTRPPETTTTKPPETTTKPPETTTRPPSETTPPTSVEKPPEQPRPIAESKPTSSALKPAGIALAVVAVAGIAVGAGMSGAAAQDSKNLEDASKQHLAFGPKLQTSDSNGPMYDTLSYVFYGIGAAAAVAAAVTLYFGFKKSPAHAQISPAVGSNHAGLFLTGSF